MGNKLLTDIKAFHRRFGFAEPPRPSFMGPKHMEMRLNFLLEELTELASASGFHLVPTSDADFLSAFEFQYEDAHAKYSGPRDVASALDAVVDLLYVLFGTALLMGMLRRTREADVSVLLEAWDRVHRANMTKVRSRDSDKAKRGGQYDVVKPPGWVAPDLSDLVEP